MSEFTANTKFHICLRCLACDRQMEAYADDFTELVEMLDKVKIALQEHLQNNHGSPDQKGYTKLKG